MGSTQSYLSSQSTITAILVVCALGLGYSFRPAQPLPLTDTPKAQDNKKRKKKKAKDDLLPEAEGSSTPRAAEQPASIQVVSFPEVIPGQFDSAPEAPDSMAQSQTLNSSKAKKVKKRKTKGQDAESATPVPKKLDQQEEHSEASPVKPSKTKQPRSEASISDLAGSVLRQSSTSVDTDGSWTRVDRKRGSGGEPLPSAEATTSDAGLTTSVTGNSSPVAERTEDESFSPNPRGSGENRRTLAEKLLPKARKTGVEDLLDEPDVPTLSRVMRIKPGPDEKPASGFSWADYEDVRVTDGGENDADGEDDGWGVVQSRKPKTSRPASASASQVQVSQNQDSSAKTKKQRQNAQKKEAQKATKVAAEEERLAALARHKRDLERLRIAEQASKPAGKTVSGGMKASVNENGKLVWE
ncbi:hypothetical protein FA15DRAFT_619886 [Coprinopsis marcescibilis]|uniref:Uncharacterized protein n=1 Tax=Coprinopsis marcescibilis TaxID=230819 RepID=A0A5C3KU27_COPMA|nr:hypothetical protein FA15DRAFT_619886 [Coprinopsis marcescibilis]